MAFEDSIGARFAHGMSKAGSYPITVDNTVRRVTLGPGFWRLRGSSTQVYFATRRASAADGTLVSGEAAAPETLPAGAAGSPGEGLAWGTGYIGTDAASSTKGAIPLETDSTLYREFPVPAGSYLNIYVATASGTATPVLEGPYECI